MLFRASSLLVVVGLTLSCCAAGMAADPAAKPAEKKVEKAPPAKAASAKTAPVKAVPAKVAPAKVAPTAAAKPAPPKTPAAKPAPAVSFSKQIAPILLKNCAGCHGPTEPKGEYQVSNYATLVKPGESGEPAVTPGKVDASELYRLISSTDEVERMPRDADPLPADQVALVKRWIEQGARFDGPDKQAPLASLVPRKIHPAPPETYRVPLAVTALAFRPDGKELAVGGYHEVTIWDAATGKLLRRVKNVEERTYALAYSADGAVLAVAGGTPGQSGEISLYDPAKATLVRTLGMTSDVAFCVAFNPAGTKLAAGAADRSIRIYDLKTGREERLIEDHADWVMGLAWSADGKQLVSASRDKTSKVFDVATGESVATYPGHSETVYSVAFSSDGKLVYSAGADKRIHVWNPADGKQSATITGYGGEVFRVILRDGQLYSSSADKTAREHKAADRAQVRSLTGHKDYVYALDVNSATKRLATGSFDGEVRIWNLADGKLVTSFQAAPGYPPAQTAKK